MAETDPYLRAAILEAVENQLQGNDPPEARQAYERLLGEGLPPEEAKRLIACVLVSEIFDVMKSGQPYNAARYTKGLSRLPNLPS